MQILLRYVFDVVCRFVIGAVYMSIVVKTLVKELNALVIAVSSVVLLPLIATDLILRKKKLNLLQIIWVLDTCCLIRHRLLTVSEYIQSRRHIHEARGEPRQLSFSKDETAVHAKLITLFDLISAFFGFEAIFIRYYKNYVISVVRCITNAQISISDIRGK